MASFHRAPPVSWSSGLRSIVQNCEVREFERVFVDADCETIVWPNGADLDPIVLYAAVTKQSVESLLASTAVR
jgi:hypothetical protein